MTTPYTCELCKKIFAQKIDYTRHKNKKTPCITIDEIKEIVQIKEIKTDDKNILINVFKNCLNILRDNEGLTGEKALKNLSYLLTLKLLEPHLGKEIDIENYEYDFSHIDPTELENTKKKLFEIIKFSNLATEKEENLKINITCIWNDILSVHPKTKNIFLKNKDFDIQYNSTFKKLINKINYLELTKTEFDVLGNAYEEVIQDIMTGKVLGQFFTQPLIKKMMVKLINPKIFPDGKIETCGDPAMGTGGFLITYLQYIMQQFNDNKIKPDWDFITKNGLYGKELDPDTYNLANSNMLISSGHLFENLENGDSIRNPIIKKFDNILANPPFGIKGLNYDDFKSSIKSEYIPIKTDNAVSLFIQAIIYMLKINGKCAVIIPDGQDLFSKTNTTLILIREYLMKTCDLKEIIYLPYGIFKYTTIKKFIFYFIKKKEGSEVLKTDIKITKTKKENRNYEITKTLQTKNVKFYDYNPYENIKNLLIKVPIEKIVNNSYSLNYAEYMNGDINVKSENDIVFKTLGEICNFLPKSKRNAKYGNETGLYPFFKSSSKINSFVDTPDFEEESLIIGDGGEPNINYGIKFSASDHCYILQNKTKEMLNLKYVYYYLFHNLDKLRHLYLGVAIKNISKLNISNIKIPIPTIEKQKEIVEYCDYNNNLILKLEKEITNHKTQTKSFLTNILNTPINEEKINEETC